MFSSFETSGFTYRPVITGCFSNRENVENKGFYEKIPVNSIGECNWQGFCIIEKQFKYNNSENNYFLNCFYQ